MPVLLGVSAFGGSGEPGEFHEAVAIEAEETAVVGVALSLEVGFEKERDVDFRFHQYSAGCGKPAIELFRPGVLEDFRGASMARSQVRRSGLEERSGGALVVV